MYINKIQDQEYNNIMEKALQVSLWKLRGQTIGVNMLTDKLFWVALLVADPEMEKHKNVRSMLK